MIRLEEVTLIRAPIERCFDLARSVEVHLAGNIHFGEQAVAAAGVTSGLIELGQRVTWRAKHFYAWHTLTSEITTLERPAYFQDVMVRGIFPVHAARSLLSSVVYKRDGDEGCILFCGSVAGARTAGRRIVSLPLYEEAPARTKRGIEANCGID